MRRATKSSTREPVVTYEQFDLPREMEAEFDFIPAPAPTSTAGPSVPPATASDTPVAGTMLVAAGGTIEGKVAAASHVRVAGILRGRLEADSVFIARGGLVDGEITARMVHVEGTLRGAVTAAEVEILGCAVVEANLTYDEIDIARGARVSGLHRRREAPAPEQPMLALASATAAAAFPPGLATEAEQALQALAAVAHAAAAAAAELAGDSSASLAELEEELRNAGAVAGKAAAG
ncbi:bactofilin family protein [Paracraurococcus ruber]|uniref:Polymer-forming cytoskeletal protein n=1 Tax=Paracraurococcus ruber TaxID=77675 RepID=A0ABS1CQJ9_9PROT|nr:polymer-forming cytoskeletal protein [Paracraurococcus ruber]MBK1656623.1 hypothetical protein [Paracraurococcus ruber]TDG33753.1 polymer-forming cytoskeletal protein [Paracraurococcus ruber]